MSTPQTNQSQHKKLLGHRSAFQSTSLYDVIFSDFNPLDQRTVSTTITGHSDVLTNPADNSLNPSLTSPPIVVFSLAVQLLIIVASLTLVVGLVYILIYFKSIKPMSARSRNYVEQGKGHHHHAEEEGGRGRSAHPFIRRS